MLRPLPLLIAAVLVSVPAHGWARGTGEGVATRQPAESATASPGKKSADQTVTVRNARLERSQGSDDSQAAVLKFDLTNEGETSVTDIVLSVAVLDGSAHDTAEPREPVVRPFRIRIDYALRSGYSVDYEIRLKNLVFDSDCVPAIEVIQSRIVAEEAF